MVHDILLTQFHNALVTGCLSFPRANSHHQCYFFESYMSGGCLPNKTTSLHWWLFLIIAIRHPWLLELSLTSDICQLHHFGKTIICLLSDFNDLSRPIEVFLLVDNVVVDPSWDMLNWSKNVFSIQWGIGFLLCPHFHHDSKSRAALYHSIFWLRQFTLYLHRIK